MAYNPAALRRVMRDLVTLKQDPPEGVRIVMDDGGEDILGNLKGIIAGPEGTPFEGGYFRVAFTFPPEFPSVPPKCQMLTKIFHPNFSSSGEICVNTLKKDWNSSYGVSHILVTIKCLLIHPNPESALDEEAGKLLLEDYQEYCRRARIITRVHATPKLPPPEFENAAEPATGATSAPIITPPSTAPVSLATTSIANGLPSNTSNLAPSSHKPRSVSGSKRRSPPPCDDENAASTVSISSIAVKDSTSDVFVKDHATKAASVLQPSTSNGNVSNVKVEKADVSAKRPAAPSSGVEKKKKALKRL